MIEDHNKKGERMKGLSSVKVTTLVDNDVWRDGLTSTWGLSLYVEAFRKEKRNAVLMDTNGSFNDLFGNASKLGIDLSSVEVVFISHWHGDHCGSLSHVLPLLSKSTPTYVPSKDISGIRKIIEAGGTPTVCSEPFEFVEGVMSTGEVGGWTSEHSLVMNVKNKGLVILTGCSHPGVMNILRRATQASGVSKVYAIIGGFHISENEAVTTANYLYDIDVKLVSPCHCTSENIKKIMSAIMGKRCVRNGSGRIFSI